MSAYRDLIHRYVRCCLHCGSLFPNSGLLCEHCEKSIEPFLEYEDLALPFVKTLYLWRPAQSDILSNLMLHLKGSLQARAWQYYAQKFLRIHLFSESRRFEKIIVVPAPARGKARDHAFHWGQALSQGLGAHFLPCLRKSPSGDEGTHQKSKGRSERDLIRFEVNEISTIPPISNLKTLWIFADDIYTTGSTARAAYEALGTPVNFEVWALSKRSLSCGASKVLL